MRIPAAILLALGVSLILARPALADPRLDEVVYSPYVENHQFEFETREGRENGGPLGGSNTLVLEAEYGLSDQISLALVGAGANIGHGGFSASKIGLEGIAYIGQVPGLGIDTGLYLEYAKGLNGQDDSLEAKLLLAKTEGRFQGLVNVIVERPVGVPAGQGISAYGYAASTTWRTVGNLRLGLEAFGDLGDDHGFLNRPQGAYLGPQVKWEGRPKGSPVEIAIDAGWLAAVGESRQEGRSQFRINVEFERHF